MEEVRPPFVQFENRPIEDRAASLAAGYRVMRDVPFIIIVPHGSEGKTRIENRYEDWLKKVRGRGGEQRAAGAGADTPAMVEARFPQIWLDRIQAAFEAWKKGEELEIEGTPLRNWPVISKAQLGNCEGIHIRSVEELAGATDDTVARLGMGGMQLRQRARDWLKSQSGDAGRLSLQLEAQRVQIEALETANAALRERVQELEAQVQATPAVEGD